MCNRGAGVVEKWGEIVLLQLMYHCFSVPFANKDFLTFTDYAHNQCVKYIQAKKNPKNCVKDFASSRKSTNFALAFGKTEAHDH